MTIESPNPDYRAAVRQAVDIIYASAADLGIIPGEFALDVLRDPTQPTISKRAPY